MKRIRDCILLSNIEVIENILEAYHFTAEKFIETDNSITLSLNEIDLIENAETEKETRLKLGKAILEYSNDYYDKFSFWSSAPNRKNHMPYVMKALIIDSAEKIGNSIQCQDEFQFRNQSLTDYNRETKDSMIKAKEISKSGKGFDSSNKLFKKLRL